MREGEVGEVGEEKKGCERGDTYVTGGKKKKKKMKMKKKGEPKVKAVIKRVHKYRNEYQIGGGKEKASRGKLKIFL